jgi:copper oxidase (laccase) domain-containing protein
MTSVPFETFPLLETPGVAHAFVQRVPGVDVQVDREQALQRLADYQAQVRRQLGFKRFAFGEQVHGKEIAVLAGNAEGWVEVGPEAILGPIAAVDGLVTNQPGLCLGVQVADCCAVYLFDPVRHCIGLAHSGRKGTELGIVPEAISKMREAFGSNPADIRVQLSPCIRPPHYEIDFAAEILRQCREAGVIEANDCGSNTGADLQRYYSYRIEKGKTGRMLALLGLKSRV